MKFTISIILSNILSLIPTIIGYVKLRKCRNDKILMLYLLVSVIAVSISSFAFESISIASPILAAILIFIPVLIGSIVSTELSRCKEVDKNDTYASISILFQIIAPIILIFGQQEYSNRIYEYPFQVKFSLVSMAIILSTMSIQHFINLEKMENSEKEASYASMITSIIVYIIYNFYSVFTTFNVRVPISNLSANFNQYQ